MKLFPPGWLWESGLLEAYSTVAEYDGFTGGTLDCQTELLQSEKIEQTVWSDERKRLQLIGLCLPRPSLYKRAETTSAIRWRGYERGNGPFLSSRWGLPVAKRAFILHQLVCHTYASLKYLGAENQPIFNIKSNTCKAGLAYPPALLQQGEPFERILAGCSEAVIRLNQAAKLSKRLGSHQRSVMQYAHSKSSHKK